MSQKRAQRATSETGARGQSGRVLGGVAVEVDVIRPATPSATDLNRTKMVYVAVANLVAVIFCVAIFWGLLMWPEGTKLDGAMGTVWRFLRRHETIAALAASLPFFASLLVGQFEMRKARAKRTRREAEEKRVRLEVERAQQESERLARRSR
jgi:hypothetical protein